MLYSTNVCAHMIPFPVQKTQFYTLSTCLAAASRFQFTVRAHHTKTHLRVEIFKIKMKGNSPSRSQEKEKTKNIRVAPRFSASAKRISSTLQNLQTSRTYTSNECSCCITPLEYKAIVVYALYFFSSTISDAVFGTAADPVAH